MTNVAKLLIFLNPDVANFYDIARYLYSSEMNIDERQVKTRTTINNARLLGWDIAGDQNRGYVLSDEHYELVQANQGGLCNRRLDQRLTPENVKRWAA